MQQLVAELRSTSDAARDRAAAPNTSQRHREQGKLPVRERIDRLIDPGSPFLELSPLAAHDMYDDEAPRRGSRDRHRARLGPRSGRRRQRRDGQGRHVLPDDRQEAPARAADRAREPPAVRLPGRFRRRVSADAGRRLSRSRAFRPDLLQSGAHVGRSGFRRSPSVMGSCTAGGAYVPAMSDETIIVNGTGTIFLGGPPLVKAATGEEVTAEELGGADVHTRLSGVADYFAEDDAHALALCRTIVSTLGAAGKRPPADIDDTRRSAVTTPRKSTASSTPTSASPYDVREIIARLVDGSRFDEFKRALRRHARHRLRAPPRHAGRHRRQQRRAVLGVGAEGDAFHRALQPARRAAGLPAEHHRLHRRPAVRARRHRQGRREDGARGRQLGRAEVHGGHRRIVWRRQLRHVRPRLRSAAAVDVAERAHLGDGRRTGGRRAGHGQARAAGARAASRSRPRKNTRCAQPILEKYEHEGSPYYSTARLWDDGILDPLETRQALALGLSAACNAPMPAPKFGVFRM